MNVQGAQSSFTNVTVQNVSSSTSVVAGVNVSANNLSFDNLDISKINSYSIDDAYGLTSQGQGLTISSLEVTNVSSSGDAYGLDLGDSTDITVTRDINISDVYTDSNYAMGFYIDYNYGHDSQFQNIHIENVRSENGEATGMQWAGRDSVFGNVTIFSTTSNSTWLYGLRLRMTAQNNLFESVYVSGTNNTGTVRAVHVNGQNNTFQKMTILNTTAQSSASEASALYIQRSDTVIGETVIDGVDGNSRGHGVYIASLAADTVFTENLSIYRVSNRGIYPTVGLMVEGPRSTFGNVSIVNVSSSSISTVLGANSSADNATFDALEISQIYADSFDDAYGLTSQGQGLTLSSLEISNVSSSSGDSFGLQLMLSELSLPGFSVSDLSASSGTAYGIKVSDANLTAWDGSISAVTGSTAYDLAVGSVVNLTNVSLDLSEILFTSSHLYLNYYMKINTLNLDDQLVDGVQVTFTDSEGIDRKTATTSSGTTGWVGPLPTYYRNDTHWVNYTPYNVSTYHPDYYNKTYSVGLLGNNESNLTVLQKGVLYVGCGEISYSDSINDAISAAEEGDTVFVCEGAYHESVQVDKPLNINGNGTVTIYGNSPAMTITADHTNVSNLTLTNGSIGINISASNVLVSQVRIENISSSTNAYGILDSGCEDSTFSQVDVINVTGDFETYGVYLISDSIVLEDVSVEDVSSTSDLAYGIFAGGQYLDGSDILIDTIQGYLDSTGIELYLSSDHITLQNLTIKNILTTQSSSYSYGILLSGNHTSISGLSLEGVSSSGSSGRVYGLEVWGLGNTLSNLALNDLYAGPGSSRAYGIVFLENSTQNSFTGLSINNVSASGTARGIDVGTGGNSFTNTSISDVVSRANAPAYGVYALTSGQAFGGASFLGELSVQNVRSNGSFAHGVVNGINNSQFGSVSIDTVVSNASSAYGFADGSVNSSYSSISVQNVLANSSSGDEVVGILLGNDGHVVSGSLTVSTVTGYQNLDAYGLNIESADGFTAEGPVSVTGVSGFGASSSQGPAYGIHLSDSRGLQFNGDIHISGIYSVEEVARGLIVTDGYGHESQFQNVNIENVRSDNHFTTALYWAGANSSFGNVSISNTTSTSAIWVMNVRNSCQNTS
ncbi:MAG: hypothetical protein GF414_00005, partial [Candidatus Altiarchaeales archaeon]|nr:hypothetical protein [Candidatus Altiarchaeales archaeon]